MRHLPSTPWRYDGTRVWINTKPSEQSSHLDGRRRGFSTVEIQQVDVDEIYLIIESLSIGMFLLQTKLVDWFLYSLS